MHYAAMEHGRRFFETYVADDLQLKIVDIGAQDVNGSLRSVAPSKCEYVGVDFEKGRGVDVLITDPYKLPFEDSRFDVCVSSSCFEHSEFFWLSFLEMMRVLKPSGLLYLNVPSNGRFHRYPVDCWRFYPDSGSALQEWGRRNGFGVVLLESFVGHQMQGTRYNDFVAVFVRDEEFAERFNRRIVDSLPSFTNGKVRGKEGFINYNDQPQDQWTPAALSVRAAGSALLRALGRTVQKRATSSAQ